jgi:uncharacterized phage infection (PIP) family protein YhgE
VDLDEVAEELYGSSPDEFVERRTQRAAEARQAGDRTLAKQISQLRRPTRTAWMVNLLARDDVAEINQLLDLGRALQDAQQRAAGDDLRKFSKQRRVAVDALTRKAADLARTAGHAPTEATIQEVSQTLQAALADPAVADLVQRGRLTQAATYGGFGPGTQQPDSSTDLLAALAASATAQQARPGRDQDEAEPDQIAGPDPEAQRELEEAVRSWETAAGEATTAAEEADQATTRADELADQIESLRDQLRQAESAERDARADARAARKRAQQLRQEAAAAEQRATALREKLGNRVR